MIKFILLASRTLRHSVKTGISILIRQLGFIVWLNQSGYLTIKGYDSEFGIYQLGFPNREVEEGFMRFLLPYYAKVTKVETPFEILKFVNEVRSGDYDSFFRRLQSFFADTPYEIIRDRELHYQNVLFIVFKLMGFYVKVEYHMGGGASIWFFRLISLFILWSSSLTVRLKKPYDKSMRSIMRGLSRAMRVNYSR